MFRCGKQFLLLVLSIFCFYYFYNRTHILVGMIYDHNSPVGDVDFHAFRWNWTGLIIVAILSIFFSRISDFEYSEKEIAGKLRRVYLNLKSRWKSEKLNPLCHPFSYAEIKSATSNFDDALVIGRGKYGKVYKGVIDINGPITVAIKRFGCKPTEFWTQVEMQSKFRHSNVVTLIGYCSSNGDEIAVYEYVTNGTLANHIFNSRLSWAQRLKICIGAARGLDYLHTVTQLTHRVLQRDVNTKNILLDENWDAKISDFGLINPDPSVKWTTDSDVYSFGVVMIELLWGSPVVNSSFPKDQQVLLKKIAIQCMNNSPKNGPTMAEVVASLERALPLQARESSSTAHMDADKRVPWWRRISQFVWPRCSSRPNDGGHQIRLHTSNFVDGSRVVESSESDLGTIGITRDNFSEANQLEQTFAEHRESDGGVEVQMQQMSLESTVLSSTHLSSSLTWTSKQNKLFELALQLYDKNYPDRWQKVAAIVGDEKSVDDIKSHYEMHVLDLVNTKSDMILMPRDAFKPHNSKVIMTDQLNVSVGEFRQEVMKETPIWGEDEATRVTNTANMEFENLPDYLKRCILYCSVFPFGYEIQSDKLVQLWIAVGLIEAERTLEMEDIGRLYFEILVCKEFILPLRYDNLVCQFKYIMNESMVVKGMSLGDYPRVEKGILGDTSKMATHLSLLSKDVGPTTFETLENYKHLQTLLLVHNFESSIRHIPRDLFLSLKLLRILDLSRTHISELPNSIGNLDSLRYLDISETPIIRLSDSVDRLQVLQTLKLNGCVCLHRLPKGMKKLISLRHLDFDIVRQLKSMPLGMGNLTSLQTLRAFLVSKEDGCGIGELKKLNKLRGSFCITGLENVLNPVEASEADLSNKHYLDKLELQWGNKIQDEKCEAEMEMEMEILECLQPHSGIKELKILFYKGLMLPSWISNPSFADIVSITLYKCLNCHLLPSVGELPSLKFLKLFEMNKVRYINHLFCRNQGNGGYRAFPKLEKLTLDVMLSLEEWTSVENGDFPCLLQLSIKHCPKIVVIPSLSHLSSLKHLELSHCTTLQSFPEEGLPASLEFLIIADCPGIKEQCKMAHVSNIWIDHQEVSSN